MVDVQDVRGRVVDDDCRRERQVGAHMRELTGLERAPVRAVVERLARHDDRGIVGEVVSPVLLDEAVGRLEKPEARVHPHGRGAQAEEPAHQSASTAR
jgi:hypothetical protein